MRIKRNDTVIAIAGRSAGTGKTGKVLQLLPERDLAIVEGFNIVKKALRKTQDNPQGGIGEKETPMALSNLLPYCPTCKKGTRISRAKENKQTVRKCRKCGHAFD
jgi:large subunit ribosomal protein L24